MSISQKIATALRSLSDRIAPLKKNMCGGACSARYDTRHWTRDQLVECIADMVMADHKPNESNWFNHFLVQDHENKRLRQILESRYHNESELNRALHVADLEAKNKRLRTELRGMQVSAERRNRESWATGLIVNCTGCDSGGPEKYEDLTEDRVEEVERLAGRLRRWWDNHEYRRRHKEQASA